MDNLLEQLFVDIKNSYRMIKSNNTAYEEWWTAKTGRGMGEE
jgi:hypothetical protein